MTPKQQKFADEYIKTGNATQSAIKAGYSKDSARVIGQENLSKPALKEYIDNQLKEIHSEKIADANEVLEYLTSVMRGDETESVTTGKDVFEGVEVSAKDRIKAAELIGKRHSLFTDRVEQTNTNIEIEIGDFEDDD